LGAKLRKIRCGMLQRPCLYGLYLT
jgi:hypothetical protein